MLCVLLSFSTALGPARLACVQINNLKNLPTMFSSKHTSAHWKAVRKGVSPAFNQTNIRCTLLSCCVSRASLAAPRLTGARPAAGGCTPLSLVQWSS